jgi:hypothetical protein
MGIMLRVGITTVLFMIEKLQLGGNSMITYLNKLLSSKYSQNPMVALPNPLSLQIAIQVNAPIH